MKLSRLFILVIILHISNTVWSQNTNLTLKRNDISLQEIFNTIEKETYYRFFYNNDEVDVSKIIDIDISNKPVEEVLKQVFKDLPYTFREFENNLILIESVSASSESTDNIPFDRHQKKEITGLVTDKSGSPLPGVTVTVEGTNSGTITNANGEFSLALPSSAKILTFSFVGMRTQNILVEDKLTYRVILIDEAIGLEEIVVIGYGSIKKSDLTGSVAVVSSDELNKFPISDFTRALQGRAPGVMVAQSGVPGAAAQIRVRGIGSINQTSGPIYVIDGVITNNLLNIDPADIEGIQVLKDASAAAIYGADGANGVIIVSTRRGEKGKPKISLSSFFTLNRVPKKMEIMNASEYSSFYSRLLTENNITKPLAYTEEFRQWYYGEGWQNGTDWQNEITRIAPAHNHNVRISGGGEGSNYSVSANYFKENGILLSTDAERFNLRANSDFKLGKFIKIGETISLTRLISQNASVHEGNPWHISLITSPLMRVHNANNKGGFEGPQIPFEYMGPTGEPEIVVNTGFNDKVNPRAPLELGDFRSYQNNVLASMYVEAKVLKWFTFRTMPSVDFSSVRQKNWFPAFDLGVRSRNQAQLNESYNEGMTLSLENQLTFNKTFKKHQITATAVHHVRKSENNIIEATAQGFPYEQLNVISQSYEEGRQVRGTFNPFASESYLGRIIYNYENKYLFTGSIRRDGNSRFGPQNRWGTFPSLSVAWKVNEDFLKNLEQISMLKMRFGWGRTGNSNIGSFQYMSLLDGFSNFSPVFGINQHMVPALNVIHSFGNPYIKWEAAEMLNLGMDLNLFDNKIQFILEYFIKNQDDLLVKIPMSAAYGRVSGAGDPWVNLGELQNKGFEFTGIYRKMEGALNYNVSAHFSTIKNQVKYVPGEILSGNNLTLTGHSIGSFYGYVAERILTGSDFDASGNYQHALPATGIPSPGDLKFKDLNNDGIINDLDRTIIGKAVPDFSYSLNIEAFWKNIDFSVFIFGLQNFDVYNHLRADIEGFSSQDLGHNKLKDFAVNYYTPERSSTRYVRADLNNTNQNNRPSSWFLEKGSFLRLKDIQIGYSVPLKHTIPLGIAQARVFLSATNTLTFTGYTGRDPEVPTISDPLNPGNDNGTYPMPRSVTAGVQIGF
ncbi:MAG: TonB-dependent receptor [Mariniphaga sp.]|nr:TonB-dependent receptor [Mariniphaga sp.]